MLILITELPAKTGGKTHDTHQTPSYLHFFRCFACLRVLFCYAPLLRKYVFRGCVIILIILAATRLFCGGFNQPGTSQSLLLAGFQAQ